MNENEEKKITLRINLSRIITIGLSIALILMTAGFIVNAAAGKIELDIEKLEKNTSGLKEFYSSLKNTDNLIIFLLSHLGIFILILVPAAGVIFSLIYFILKKNWKPAAISIGVILVLILSGVIGFIKP
ncbi:MAG: DUF1634 domain-containing protein [Actinobacteria bacterium]|nr:DUF1634 domain-containing protein [Actinomycetota bacterium]